MQQVGCGSSGNLRKRIAQRQGKCKPERERDPGDDALELDPAYIQEMNEAYKHFFFHYTSTPLLVVETSQLELHASEDALDDLIRQIKSMNRGTQYYVPRT